MKVPENNKLDYLHTSVKAILSSIPTVGGAASEFFNALVVPPIEKRRKEWMENVTSTLIKLESKQTGWLERLYNNEEFNTLLIAASISAFKTHQREKHDNLKNCLLNSVNSSSKFDIKQLYIQFVDELTSTHLIILQFIIQFEKEIKDVNGYQKVYNILTEGTIDTSVPKIEGIEITGFRFLLKDLETKGLIFISSEIIELENQIYEASYRVSGDLTENKLPFLKATDFGKEFIFFVTNNMW